MTTVFRPTASRLLAGGIFVICVVVLVAMTQEQGLSGLIRHGWWVLLAGVLGWALFWRPLIAVDDAGVVLVNVLRTVRLPWPAIEEIDTKWSLTLRTAYGNFGAWAAPAPGRHGTRDVTEQDVKHLPESTYGVGHSVRPGDTMNSPSGRAAGAIRRRWEELRDAGHLDNPRLEFDRAPVRWHIGTMVVIAALVALGLAGSLL